MFLKLGPVFSRLDVFGHLEDFWFSDHFQTKLLDAKYFQIEIFAVLVIGIIFRYYRSERMAFKHVEENIEERNHVISYCRILLIQVLNFQVTKLSLPDRSAAWEVDQEDTNAFGGEAYVFWSQIVNHIPIFMDRF